MLRYSIFFAICLVVIAADPPSSWIDPDTGHRIVRLTNEPNSASLYFNQNGYTANGKRLVYTTPEGISVLNLESKQARQVVRTCPAHRRRAKE
jgi:oligogalacturonide lyase